MDELLEIISNDPSVDKLLNNQGRLIIKDDLSLSYLVCAAYKKKPSNISIICSNLYSAQNLYEKISNIVGENNCLLFPVDEVFHERNVTYSKEMVSQRLYVLSKTFLNEKKILICHSSSITRLLPDKEIYQKRILTFKVGETYSLSSIIKTLTDLSFTRVNKIDQSLEFALRGDILDIFPVNKEYPIRIEFFDDEIESIREFNIENQQAFNEIKEVTIFPSSDLFYDENDFETGKKYVEDKLLSDIKNLDVSSSKELRKVVENDLDRIKMNGFDENNYRYFHFFTNRYNIFSYFKSDLNIIYNRDEINSSYEIRNNEYNQYIDEMYHNGMSLNDTFFSLTLDEALKDLNNVEAFSYEVGADDYSLEIKSIPFYARNLINSLNLIKEYSEANNRVIVCLDNNYFDNFKEFLKTSDVTYELIDKDKLPKSNLSLVKYDLKEGFELKKEGIVYLSKREIFGYKQNLTVFSSRYKKAQILNSFNELEVGDYIVHNENGIGRFEGIETVTANNITADYLKISYANEQVLFIPLMKFSTIRKYVSKEGSVPRLSRIGDKDWSNTKEKIKEKVNFLAERLIELYAERKNAPGFAFKEDDEFQEQFEASFPYKMTRDQEEAIEAIKKDMEKPSPMERLLCGDVGFGKTEVALRAAFKAINSGKQVALLCPTTILAKQHYDIAMSRFAIFGVKIALFSRFVSAKEQKNNIQLIKEGKIHFIIGTHRILSKEISIPNLGLLIVDEEQRFGVEHKERIKEMTKNIDVLTLTATPIPRTLQMSLVGIRNLSQLQTPPSSRMPIQTYVTPYNARIAKEAIARELSRGGQIYYLHNRVSSIYQCADSISKMVPNSIVGVVHAKMDKEDIEEIMEKFYLGEINVLVCTSIVEAGLDVPNANTIIVENVDTFGLSQLYQIKGRVGRSNRVAYAYLFYNENKELNEVAKKRLDAIKEFTELGSGIKIAQMDLNIRGAGDILGPEQSGFINSVGMDMYISILNEVVKEKRGEVDDKHKVKTTNISFGGYIPNDYAIDSDKIQLYQEIENCTTLSSIEVFRRKIRDIYGRIPKEVEKILLKRRVDILSSCELIESVCELDYIFITFTKLASTASGFALTLNKKLMPFVKDINVRFEDKKFIIKISKNKDLINVVIPILEAINSIDILNN